MHNTEHMEFNDYLHDMNITVTPCPPSPKIDIGDINIPNFFYKTVQASIDLWVKDRPLEIHSLEIGLSVSNPPVRHNTGTGLPIYARV